MIEITASALLFDLDGVLIDSTPAVSRVWARWAQERGFDPAGVVAHAHGRPSLATVRKYLPQADHEAENREVERREMTDVDGIVLLPGARRLLASLPSERWTIATSCTRPLAEVRLRAAGLPVPERLVTATDVTRGKPHPEPFLKPPPNWASQLRSASSSKTSPRAFALARWQGRGSSLFARLFKNENFATPEPTGFLIAAPMWFCSTKSAD